MTAHIYKSTLSGAMYLPPSKSMAHRLLLCAAMAGGASSIHNLDFSADITATAAAVAQLGAAVTNQAGGSVAVRGTGGSFTSPAGPVNCNESGSTLRFLIPLFALQKQPVTFTGAARLFQRPLNAYADIFARQGLPFTLHENRLTLCGPLQSGHFVLPGDVSSQFISGLLLAAPLLKGGSVIEITPPFESRSYVQLTRAAQRLFGVHSRWLNEHTLEVEGGQTYRPATCTVEGDWSQGVVPGVLAAVRGGIAIKGLSQNSPQGDTAFLQVLQRCGAAVQWRQPGEVLCIAPPPGGLCAPGQVNLADCPDLGPVLCALALFCRGTTQFVNAGRLRIKESDRIATVETELQKLGGRISSTKNTITVEGGAPLRGGATLSAHNDHRVVMAAAVAALAGGMEITIEGAQAVRKSWPGFFEDLRKIGGQVKLYDEG